MTQSQYVIKRKLNILELGETLLRCYIIQKENMVKMECCRL